MTSKTPSVLDLNSEITPKEFRESVTSLVQFFTELASERGWCPERHRYFEAVVPGYIGEGQLGYVSEDYSPDDPAAELRNIRGRILWYTRAGTVSLDDANRMFAAARLQEYVLGNKPGHRVQVALPHFEVNIGAGDVTDAEEWAREHMIELITAMLDGRKVDDNRYVPGSVAFTSSGVSACQANSYTSIPEADTVRPSYDAG